MPELPEVETIARGVHQRVQGDRIVDVWFGRHPQPFKTPARPQAEGLQGQRILSVRRVGKHLVMELGRDAAPAEPQSQWIVHLGMTGRLLVTGADEPVAKHTHARLTLRSGKEIRFVDPRRFGRLAWRNLEREAPFAAAGQEPLTIESERFARLFRGRRSPIKAALLDQSLLTGVGNIYADEGLFRAGIRPRRQAGRLKRDQLERLRLALQSVLEQAIALGGSSVSDYVDASGMKGFFQLEHCVYRRHGEPCRKCGSTIQRILIGGRGTHFCPQCQK